jgi:hypothetical protein
MHNDVIKQTLVYSDIIFDVNISLLSAHKLAE